MSTVLTGIGEGVRFDHDAAELPPPSGYASTTSGLLLPSGSAG